MKKIFYLVILISLIAPAVKAQTYIMGNLGTISTCTGTFYDSGGSSGGYGSNDNFEVTFCSNSGLPIWLTFSQFDLGAFGFDIMTVYNGNSTAAPVLGVYAGTTSPGTIYSSNASNCLTVQFIGGGFPFFQGAGWTATINCGTPPPPSPGTQCSASQPFCSGTNYNFPAATNTTAEPGPNYGCLTTQPNPVWYYMQIDQSGNLDITFTNSSVIDVDFICWGPFSSLNNVCSQLTAGNTVDCSYSTAAVEYINIPNAQSGQYYMLCITNYANAPTNFILTTDGTSTATTNCLILCNITAMTATPGACNPSTNDHDITGTLTVDYPPVGGTLTVTTSTGETVILNPPFTSSINYSIPGISSTGGSISVTAQFSTDTSCHFTTTYTSPAPCTCTSTATSNSPLCVGSTLNLLGNTIAGASYQWSGPNGYTANVQNPVINNVSVTQAGIYSLTVTLGGCTATDTTLVEVVSSPSISFTTQQVKCHGGSDGSITANVSPSGGTYLWNTNSTSQTISGLTPGIYSLTAAVGSCSATASDTITEPVAITFGNPVITDAICAVGGSITATASGGTAPLGYLWSNSQTTNAISNLAAGPYNLTVTDLNLCTASVTYTVNTSPGVISFGNPAITHVSCNEGNNGRISVSVTGGTGILNFIWNDQTTGPTDSNLTAGSYSVTVTDAASCSASITYNITEPAQMIIDSSILTQATCQLGGSICVYVSGGAGTLSYSWSNGQSLACIDSLAAGPYDLTITDQNLCMLNSSYTVTALPGVVIFGNPVITNTTCYGGSTGSITATASGGSGPISFHWDYNNTDTSTLSDIPAGIYLVTITDSAGCTASNSYVVNQPSRIVPVLSFTGLICSNHTGNATVSASGGTPGYTYLWNNFGDSTYTDNLFPGLFSVTVTDAMSCTASASETINVAPDYNVTSVVKSFPCVSPAYGNDTIRVSGGIGPFTYYIPGVDTNATGVFNNLPSGSYTWYIADSLGCSKSSVFTIPENAANDSYTVNADSTSCFQVSDGRITLTPLSGNAPYSYAINGGTFQSSNVFTGLAVGSYSIVARNTYGCLSTLTDSIAEPGQVFSTTVADSTSCFGNQVNDGSISVTPPPSINGPFEYSIDGVNFQTDSVFNNLASGSYSVITRNSSGCTNSVTAVVLQPEQFFVNASPDTILTAPGVDNPIAVVVQGLINPVYSWTPATGLSCTDCDNPTVNVSEANVFYVMVSPAQSGNCIVQDSVIVIVNGGFTMPNVFTPNGDGKNDDFGPVKFGVATIKEFRIYNRWGAMVHNNIDTWNGMFGSKEQPAGTYVYYIQVQTPDDSNPGSQKTVKQEGSFTLLR